nr:hypothetical protein [uncultured Rhodopila sp.]
MRIDPTAIPLTLIAEIADVLLRYVPGAAAVQVRWNGAVWASGRLEWLARLVNP